jgi:hypothetical protein
MKSNFKLEKITLIWIIIMETIDLLFNEITQKDNRARYKELS